VSGPRRVQPCGGALLGVCRLSAYHNRDAARGPVGTVRRPNRLRRAGSFCLWGSVAHNFRSTRRLPATGGRFSFHPTPSLYLWPCASPILQAAMTASEPDPLDAFTAYIAQAAGLGVRVVLESRRRSHTFPARTRVRRGRVRRALVDLRLVRRPPCSARPRSSRPRVRRRTGASSATSGSDPGGGDPDGEPHRLAAGPRSRLAKGIASKANRTTVTPSASIFEIGAVGVSSESRSPLELVSRPAAVLTFALLDAERRGAEVEAPR
jgi:hypothetical protein